MRMAEVDQVRLSCLERGKFEREACAVSHPLFFSIIEDIGVGVNKLFLCRKALLGSLRNAVCIIIVTA